MRQPAIRPIAICLFLSGDRFLVSREADAVKGDHYCRPLGGGIEFGELSHEAIVREIREETGQEIEDLRLVSVIENTFELEGEPHHEIVFVYDARFVDRSIYHGPLACYEITPFEADWKTLEEIALAGERLVPDGLGDVIRKHFDETRLNSTAP